MDITGTDEGRGSALIIKMTVMMLCKCVSELLFFFFTFIILFQETVTVNCLYVWFASMYTWRMSYVYVILTNCTETDFKFAKEMHMPRLSV